MRKQQHSISSKVLTVLFIFLALSTTIFMVQHTRRVQGAPSPIRYTIYEDRLASGWKARSWAGRMNLANTSPVYSGSRSVSFTPIRRGARLYLYTNTAVDTNLYSFFSFAAQASQAGQDYNVILYDGTNNPLSTVRLAHYGGDPVPGTWKVYTIPLSDLRANATQIRGVAINNRTRRQGTLYLDSMSLTGFVSSPTATPTPTPLPQSTPTPSATVTPTPTPLPQSTPTPSPTGIPIPVGYSKLIFDDEFHSTTLDTSKWITNAGRGGVCTSVDVGGIACFDPQAVSVSNGSAHIETNRQSINGFSYLAGIINTDTQYYFTYGYFDIRAKMPKGNGLWSGLWLYNTWTLPNDSNEIDIVELLGKDPTTTYQTFHNYNGGQTQFTSTDTDWTQGYHDYAVNWEPGLLVFYIDGIERGRVTTAVPSEKMYLMLDSDVGGSTAWSGPPDSSTPFPSYLDIEYVRVYE